MPVYPVENPTCAALGKYGEVPKTVPLDFMKDDLTWVASKLSDAAGALGEEAIELRHWRLRFGCVSEELRVVVTRLADSMASSPPSGPTHVGGTCPPPEDNPDLPGF